MINRIIIGSRGSKLSTAYTEKAKNLIVNSDQKLKSKILYKKIKTTGDRLNEKKISEIGGKNLFCKEIEEKLLSKEIDIAIHSLKDLDSYETAGLKIQAFLKRNDPREALVSEKKFENLNQTSSAVIGSSSRRRELQLKLLNNKFKVKNIRGNVDTRIKKIESGEYDGAILAMAGLISLKLEEHVKKIFSIKEFLPTAGQGIIAVQCRSDDEKIKSILNKINDTETEICALAERSFLKTLGGDCDTALGCFAELKDKTIILKVQLFSDDGKKVFNLSKDGNYKEATLLGRLLGEEILKKAGDNFIKKR